MLHFCSKFPSIVTPKQEFHSNAKNVFPTTRFRVYKVVSHCTVHGRCQFEEKGTGVLHSTILPENSNASVYSLKELVITDTYIYDHHEKSYIQ